VKLLGPPTVDKVPFIIPRNWRASFRSTHGDDFFFSLFFGQKLHWEWLGHAAALTAGLNWILCPSLFEIDQAASLPII